MPAWITNYALSTGVIKLEDDQFKIAGNYIYYTCKGFGGSVLIGKDGFLSEDEAIKDVQNRKHYAQSRRNDEYLKLQKKREKLDKFDPAKAVRDAKSP